MVNAFTGTFIFEAQLKLLGTTVKRRMRVTYEYTPEWPFFDPENGRDRTEEERIAVGLEILAEPRTEGLGPKEPYWTTANDLVKVGVLKRRVWDRIDVRIDADARAQDLERRQKANPTKAHLPNSYRQKGKHYGSCTWRRCWRHILCWPETNPRCLNRQSGTDYLGAR